MMYSLLNILLFLTAVTTVTSECEPEWFEYNGEKCYRLFDEFATADVAAKICSQFPYSTKLLAEVVQIRTKDEQEFLSALLFQEWEIYDNVWLGATRFNATHFQWGDGTDLIYTNWDANSPSENPANNCTQLSSSTSKNGNGLWKDVPCSKRNLVVCQTPSKLTLDELQRMLLELRNEVKHLEEAQLESLQTIQNMQIADLELKSEIKALQHNLSQVIDSTVPIGFIYVEYPTKKGPREIWGSYTWKEVTSEFGGMFFRAEGGDSAPFGSLQSSNAPRLISAKFEYIDFQPPQLVDVHEGSWSNYLQVGGYTSATFQKYETIKFQTSSGEVRPVNKAIKIWQRVE